MLPKKLDYYTRLPTGGYLLISSSVMDVLHAYKQLSIHDHEAGGTLIGVYRQNSPSDPMDIEITDCSKPISPDRRTRFGFHRQGKHHRAKIFSAWRRSKCEETYIGEWHTHPEEKPSPSSMDIKDWERNLSGRTAILVIIGTTTDWLGYWTGSKAVHLDPLIIDTS